MDIQEVYRSRPALNTLLRDRARARAYVQSYSEKLEAIEQELRYRKSDIAEQIETLTRILQEIG